MKQKIIFLALIIGLLGCIGPPIDESINEYQNIRVIILGGDTPAKNNLVDYLQPEDYSLKLSENYFETNLTCPPTTLFLEIWNDGHNVYETPTFEIRTGLPFELSSNVNTDFNKIEYFQENRSICVGYDYDFCVNKFKGTFSLLPQWKYGLRLQYLQVLKPQFDPNLYTIEYPPFDWSYTKKPNFSNNLKSVDLLMNEKVLHTINIYFNDSNEGVCNVE